MKKRKRKEAFLWYLVKEDRLIELDKNCTGILIVELVMRHNNMFKIEDYMLLGQI